MFGRPHPEWVPIDPKGCHWQLKSWKGKTLGVVLNLGLSNDPAPFMARKTCCMKWRDYANMADAARYVNTVTHCTDCISERNTTRVG